MSQNDNIVPGQNVAGVRLGDTFVEFSHVFTPQPRLDQDFPGNSCWDRSYHWVDVKADATGVYAYFKEVHIFQMSVQTPRYHLSSGVKVGATKRQVLEAYPNGRWYTLLHNGGADVGGRDLDYWVDRDSGIAFSFYWSRRKAKRLVLGIDIFQKGTEYLPDGCISPPQQWQQMK